MRYILLHTEKFIVLNTRDGTELRYFYDIDGLCGIRYNGNNYVIVRNAYGDIVMIMHDEKPIVRYYYNAWGSCVVEQYEDTDDIGNINPFRWKGHYYDVESGLYYANGSYYDPEVGLHVDAMPISSAIENAQNVFGLDLNGIMCDNILAYLPCVYSIFATLELSPDPTYDPNANKSGWELFWQGVAEWFNNLSNEQKIGWGIVALLAACLVAAATSFATGGTSWAMLAAMANVFMEFAVGVISYVALSACMALISGGDVAETISNSTADAIFLGGIFSFVSSGINAVKVGIRSAYNAKLPGSLAAGAQPQSTVNQCFKEGTLVETEEGLKPIEEIAVGDKVLAYDEATGEQAYKPVLRLFRNTSYEWIIVKVNGVEIESTPGHKYYLPEITSWVSAKDLKVGTKVLISDDSFGIVEEITYKYYNKAQTTYNFEVADFHTYYVSGSKVLVHNRNCGVGGKGWEGDKIWRENVKTVSQGGDILELKGGIPTQSQAERLVTQAKGTLLRADNAHLPPNPHIFPHINYLTSSGKRGMIRLISVNPRKY